MKGKIDFDIRWKIDMIIFFFLDPVIIITFSLQRFSGMDFLMPVNSIMLIFIIGVIFRMLYIMFYEWYTVRKEASKRWGGIMIVESDPVPMLPVILPVDIEEPLTDDKKLLEELNRYYLSTWYERLAPLQQLQEITLKGIIQDKIEQDNIFWNFMNIDKQKNQRVRECHRCSNQMCFREFYDANYQGVKTGERSIGDLWKIWESEHVELLCCTCFNT